MGNGERSLPDPRGSPCPQQGAARTLWDLELWSIQRFLESLRAGSCCSIPGLGPTAPLRGGNSSARPTGIWEKLPKEASSPSHPTGQSHTQDSVSRIKKTPTLYGFPIQRCSGCETVKPGSRTEEGPRAVAPQDPCRVVWGGWCCLVTAQGPGGVGRGRFGVPNAPKNPPSSEPQSPRTCGCGQGRVWGSKCTYNPSSEPQPTSTKERGLFFYQGDTKTNPTPVPPSPQEQGPAVPLCHPRCPQAPPALRNKGRLLGCPQHRDTNSPQLTAPRCPTKL